jgi:hypothetical protein
LDLEANCQGIKRETKDNLENGEEYVGITESPYWNMMLDKKILKIKDKLIRHKSFLP